MERLTEFWKQQNMYISDTTLSNETDDNGRFPLSEEGVDILVQKLGKLEDIIDQGYVTEAPATHKRITYMRPVKRDYSDEDHPNYYKYTCPICDMLGNKHQVHKGETNCCLCNVNLLWDEEVQI